MEKQFEILLQSYNRLIDNNSSLIKAVNTSLEQSLHITNEQRELMTCGIKLYKALESKSNKTWVEQECIKLLFQFITRGGELKATP